MRAAAVTGVIVLTAWPATCACPPTTTPPNVTTAQYNIDRTGANTSETCFTAASWTAPSIQTQFTTVPSGSTSNSPVYGQPLYVYGVSISGGTHNIVIIVTLDDYVYAYDADSYTPTLYWSVALINSSSSCDCGGTSSGQTIPSPATSVPRAGILPTPVINTGASPRTVTLVGGCQITSTLADQWYLHSLNLATGADLITPVQISASVSAADNPAGFSGSGSSETLPFGPNFQLQRPALLQVATGGSSSEIYVGFGVASVGELVTSNFYHGWLIGFAAGSTSANFEFASTPIGASGNSSSPACTNSSGTVQTDPHNLCGRGGGIWQSGKGFTVYTTSSGTKRVFACTGNGGFQSSLNWGSSCLAFATTATGGPPTDSFTPYSATTLNYYDQDMGTSGTLLFTDPSSGTTYMVTFDKTGEGYVLNPANLGGYNSGDTGAVGEFAGSTTNGGTCDGGGGSSHCDWVAHQVYWSDGTNNYLFLWPWAEDIDWCYWSSSSTNFVCAPSATKTSDVFPVGFPGGSMTITSNGTSQTSAILWASFLPKTAVSYTDPGTDYTSYRGYLIAYQLQTAPAPGTSFSLEPLWLSSNTITQTWTGSPFAMPTVVNGRVYLPTYDSGVLVLATF